MNWCINIQLPMPKKLYQYSIAVDNVEVSSLRKWVELYKLHGADSFKKKSRTCYSVEFKLAVLQRMQDDELSSRQSAALFNIRRFDVVGHWKRQYDEGGVEALSLGAAVRKTTMTKQFERPSGPQSCDEDNRTRQQLLDELNYLRMENEFLKKLEALVQANKQATQRKKRESC